MVKKKLTITRAQDIITDQKQWQKSLKKGVLINQLVWSRFPGSNAQAACAYPTEYRQRSLDSCSAQKMLTAVSPSSPVSRSSPKTPYEWESKLVSAKLFSLRRNRTRETQTKSSSDILNNRNKIESMSHLWVQSITNIAQAFSSGQNCQNTLNLPV